jgi:hypothetical protein
MAPILQMNSGRLSRRSVAREASIFISHQAILRVPDVSPSTRQLLVDKHSPRAFSNLVIVRVCGV